MDSLFTRNMDIIQSLANYVLLYMSVARESKVGIDQITSGEALSETHLQEVCFARAKDALVEAMLHIALQMLSTLRLPDTHVFKQKEMLFDVDMPCLLASMHEPNEFSRTVCIAFGLKRYFLWPSFLLGVLCLFHAYSFCRRGIV